MTLSGSTAGRILGVNDGTVKCLDELQRIYKKASEAAAEKLGRG